MALWFAADLEAACTSISELFDPALTDASIFIFSFLKFSLLLFPPRAMPKVADFVPNLALSQNN